MDDPIDDPVYVFGYGSLVDLAALQAFLGRRLADGEYAYGELAGYRRCWNVAMDNSADIPGYGKHYRSARMGARPDVRVAFLNVEPHDGTAVNGLAFRVDPMELARIDRREWNYELIDVSDRVSAPLPGRVVTSVAKPEAVARFERARADGSAVVRRAYLEGVEAAFRALGAAAFARYRASTVPPDVPLMDLTRIDAL